MLRRDHWFAALLALLASQNILRVSCASGIFEIHLDTYALMDTLNTSECCTPDQVRLSQTQCADQCRVFLRMCLAVYQKNSQPKNCTIGDGPVTTQLLGHRELNKSAKRDYNITVTLRWKKDFTILISGMHQKPDGNEAVLFTISSTEQSVSPGRFWTNKNLGGSRHDYRLVLAYRFRCKENYYGPECDTFCRPRSDAYHGHYNCSDNGEIVCHEGWAGNYCVKAVCSTGCKHGRCVGPNQCSCHEGWNGTMCDMCVPYPGCAHGQCKNSPDGRDFLPLTCECRKGWGGMFCNIDLQYCTTHPDTCLNGGTCINGGDIETNAQYRCTCPPGFSGTHCEKKVHNCTHHGCSGHGQCKGGIGAEAKCECSQGFYGPLCQFNQTSCKDRPCMGNGSVCVDMPEGGFRCDCFSGFEGRNCEVDKDECASRPCQNGGQCVDQLNGYICICPVGYYGRQCQGNFNECRTLSCSKWGVCVDKANSIECRCRAGYTGPTCRADVDECAANTLLCKNNGTCLNTPGSYYCRCPSGFTGAHCEVRLCKNRNCPTLDYTVGPMTTVATQPGERGNLNIILIGLLGVFVPMVFILFGILLYVCYERRRRRNNLLHRAQQSANTFHKIENNLDTFSQLPPTVSMAGDEALCPRKVSNHFLKADNLLLADQNDIEPNNKLNNKREFFAPTPPHGKPFVDSVVRTPTGAPFGEVKALTSLPPLPPTYDSPPASSTTTSSTGDSVSPCSKKSSKRRRTSSTSFSTTPSVSPSKTALKGPQYDPGIPSKNSSRTRSYQSIAPGWGPHSGVAPGGPVPRILRSQDNRSYFPLQQHQHPIRGQYSAPREMPYRRLAPHLGSEGDLLARGGDQTAYSRVPCYPVTPSTERPPPPYYQDPGFPGASHHHQYSDCCGQLYYLPAPSNHMPRSIASHYDVRVIYDDSQVTEV